MQQANHINCHSFWSQVSLNIDSFQRSVIMNARLYSYFMRHFFNQTKQLQHILNPVSLFQLLLIIIEALALLVSFMNCLSSFIAIFQTFFTCFLVWLLCILFAKSWEISVNLLVIKQYSCFSYAVFSCPFLSYHSASHQDPGSQNFFPPPPSGLQH